MDYKKDAIAQLDYMLSLNRNEFIVNLYSEDISKIFLKIYALSYISNRVEVRASFNSDYFRLTFSCLIESLSLIVNNYPRGAALVLRSSLENFIKYIISTHDESKYSINDRSYTANKTTLEKIIKYEYVSTFFDKCNSLNSRMETEYKKLSGLSHSLTRESKSNIIAYFSHLSDINEDNLKLVFNKILIVAYDILSFCIILCASSLKNWNSSELENFLCLGLGSSSAKTFYRLIKS